MVRARARAHAAARREQPEALGDEPRVEAAERRRRRGGRRRHTRRRRRVVRAVVAGRGRAVGGVVLRADRSGIALLARAAGRRPQITL